MIQELETVTRFVSKILTMDNGGEYKATFFLNGLRLKIVTEDTTTYYE